MLRCVLVANRGEIAVRIMASARRLGLRTVAVHSVADRHALHVRCADTGIEIGGAAATMSYLDGARVIAAARAAGADCIHPGYGFLSENADFAEAVATAGLVFVGPPPAAIRAMGLKDRAKRLMEQVGVPVTPGYHGPDQDVATLAAKASDIGYPVLVKAVAGGGGKGMRRVDDASEFAAAAQAARREALAAFGNGDLLVERFVRDPRHIEMQIFADAHGNVVHLYERDCSLQRRHQKVLEEAPAPGLDAQMREAMGRAALEAARAVGYVGAGTVEFIAEGGPHGLSGRFWFMEMNTRLQVEHPVSEAITGLDLVEWQFRVAAGEPLGFTQAQIVPRGHAVEARIYAEDPQSGFLPSMGRIEALRLPAGEGIRVDAGVAQGDIVSAYYDPMIAKVIAHGPTREAALARLSGALDAMRVAGPKTNLAFLKALCDAPGVRAGQIDTGYIERHAAELGVGVRQRDDVAVRLGALALLAGDGLASVSSPWETADAFQLGPARRHGHRFEVEGEDVEVDVIWRGPAEGGPLVRFADGESSVADLGAARARESFIMVSGGVFVLRSGRQTLVRSYDGAKAVSDRNGSGDGVVRAPMHGRLVRLCVAPGDRVTAGQVMAVVDAMKMEHSLVAASDGNVLEVGAAEGAQVAQGEPIVRIGASGHAGDGS